MPIMDEQAAQEVAQLEQRLAELKAIFGGQEFAAMPGAERFALVQEAGQVGARLMRLKE